MSLNICIPTEIQSNECRVAASPEMIEKLISLGFKVSIEAGAGTNASFTDAAFKEAGAKIVKDKNALYKNANIVLKVAPPTEAEIKLLPKQALLIGLLSPYNNNSLLKSLAARDVTSFAMELVPRITRAQSMDVLSSQSNLAGYKSVLDACEHFDRALPMMMTAAGTIRPAKVFVMGAGVAGLQAIATARRLGAIVSATDVRPAAKEQVESLGATFVAYEDDEFRKAETAGGYAKEMSKSYQHKQKMFIEDAIKSQDIVITTALIPGRAAPILVSEKMVTSMKDGSVIVDLAAANGGNCTLTKADKVIKKDGVTIIGYSNVPSRLATDASALYARNLLNLLTSITDKESGALTIDWEDEVIQGIALTRDKKIIHPNFKAAPKTPAKPKPKPKPKVASKAKTTASKKSKATNKGKTS